MTDTSSIAAPALTGSLLAPNPPLQLESDELEELSSLFKLLSDKTRLAIVQLLSGGEMNVSALCRQLGLPQPTVSHHLGLLRLSHLIDNRRSGKQVFYRLNGAVCSTPAPLAAGANSRRKRTERDGAAETIPGPGVRIVGEGYSVHIIPAAICPETGA